jgi:hypothetical protein
MGSVNPANRFLEADQGEFDFQRFTLFVVPPWGVQLPAQAYSASNAVGPASLVLRTNIDAKEVKPKGRSDDAFDYYTRE